MSALDQLANSTHRCDGCGSQTSRLFDNDQCAVCHLGYLEHRSATLAVSLELAEAMAVRTLEQGVHPDDLREVLERALRDAPENNQRWRGLEEDMDAMRRAMREEIA